MVPGASSRSDEEGSHGVGNDREGRADNKNCTNNGSGDAHANMPRSMNEDSRHSLSSVDSTACVVSRDRDYESNFSASAASRELRKLWDQCPKLSSDTSCQRNINQTLEDIEGDGSACENSCGNVRVRAGKMTGPDENPSPQPLTQPGHVDHPREPDVRFPEYRDPFPVLSPMPSCSNSMSSFYANEDSRNGGLCRDSTAKIYEGEEYYVVLNDTKTEGSNVARRRPSSLQMPTRRSPTLLGSNHEKTSWLDPFPTPDISRCSTPRTPTSKTSRVVTHDSIDKTEWNRLLLALQKFPVENQVGGEPSSEIGHSSTKGKASSCSQLTRCASAQLSLQNVVSENSMKHKSASFDKIWDALQNFGPDGNELENDTAIDWRFRNRRKGKLPSGKLERHDGIENNCQNESWDDAAILPRSSSAPNGLRKRTIPEMAKASRSVEDLPSEIKPTQTRQLTAPLTPNRLDFDSRMKANRDTSSRTAPLSPGLFSPVRQRGAILSQRAKTLYRKTSERLKERKDRRRQRRLAREKKPRRSWWIVIPADHPYKIAWDTLTMLWALLGAYRTHTRIRDRVFDQSPLILLTEIWFTLDIFLNFVTEHKTRRGELIRDGKAVWARYLTTWFLIDALSLIPWERIYVRPVVEKIKRRNFFQKTFFRSKAVVRVSRILRGRHVKLFGQVSRRTGTPLHRLVQLVIKYLPKYLVFLRNMKGALLVRGLRFIHWLHNMYKKIAVKARTKALGARRKLASRRGGLSGHPIFRLQSNEEAKDKRAVEEDDTYSCGSDESVSLDDDNDHDSLVGDQSENHLHGFQNSDSPTPFARSFSGTDAY
ncbi:hypothetical protein THAOC_10292 [Thalassiosira oceanica]|uniref:Ion transport domain-containing protein n=1 Tax=Thalassiosira oceanica TaxID=159749 RepID=K0SU82_THAOC|nr:hypothetical protein THAOC_10292 [Thalassiosira oceanica]|eukprot:EJK68519.1 hypothetical protein THAOC_10292 [Thalassiosira oceanica]